MAAAEVSSNVLGLIGRALRDVRTELKVTQQDLAAMTGKSPGALSAAEKHNGVDSLTLMREYEDALGVPYGTLLLRAGVIVVPSTAVEAIKADPHLDAKGKRFVLSAYDMAKAQSN